MKTKIVGILNYTPDSFSDAGIYFDAKTAQKKIEDMLEMGADFVDIGAVSTSYGKTLLTEAEEWQRVGSFISMIAPLYGKQLSFDTFYSMNAAKALDYGIAMINDVSGGQDTDMLRIISRYQEVKYVAMCSLVLPAHRDIRCKNKLEIYDLAQKQIMMAESYGVTSAQLIIDPGIGFTTNAGMSLEVIADISFLRPLNIPIYIGHSRKSFLESLSTYPPNERDIETLTASIHMMYQCIDYLRVHDVKSHLRARRVVDAIAKAS